jgi:hypothetical protein
VEQIEADAADQPGPLIQSTTYALDADNVHPTVKAGRLLHNAVLEKDPKNKLNTRRFMFEKALSSVQILG